MSHSINKVNFLRSWENKAVFTVAPLTRNSMRPLMSQKKCRFNLRY